MNTIELRKCYEEYEWINCLISNRDVKLFDSQYDAIGYLDKCRELYVQTPSSWDLKDCEGKRVTPNRWLRVETKNDNYGVVTLRENWGLGELKDIVAYRRDKTYLDLMTEKDKNLLLDVIQRVVTDDSWREILVFGIDDSDGVYPVDIDIYPSEVKSLHATTILSFSFSVYVPKIVSCTFSPNVFIILQDTYSEIQLLEYACSGIASFTAGNFSI